MIKKKIEDITGLKLEPTENSAFGDYSSNSALNKENPRKYAEKLVKKLQSNSMLLELVEKIELAGPGFINFWLRKDILINNLIHIDREKEKYGFSKVNNGQVWEIEHTSPNPNKAMHLGHLRNNVTGMAIANIAEATGVKVVRDCVDNNRGIAIAKLMWGYLKFGRKDGKNITDISYWLKHQDEWQTPDDLQIRPDRFVDNFYVKGSLDFDMDKSVEERVRQMVIDWESEEPNNRALWKKVLEYSYSGQELTLKRLGNRWDKVWRESDHYKQGKELVELGLKKGIFKKSNGAIVTDLSKYSLPDTVVIKKDGTALYITQDLALTKLKKETFNADKLFWVIGPEQSLAMKQMFAVCEQLGIGKIEDFIHLAYGYMSIKGQGKMSSRLGNVVYIDDLLDLAKDRVKNIMDKSLFSQKDLDKISEMVGVGAVKYSILKVGRLQDIAFDINESVSIEGNSGPYIQYTIARCNSVLNKARSFNLEIGNWEVESEELLILRILIKFREVLIESANKYSPNLLCNYLYDLSQKFNSFYNKYRILEAETKESKVFRLFLTKAVGQVLKNGLKLLGIESPEKM